MGTHSNRYKLKKIKSLGNAPILKPSLAGEPASSPRTIHTSLQASSVQLFLRPAHRLNSAAKMFFSPNRKMNSLNYMKDSVDDTLTNPNHMKHSTADMKNSANHKENSPHKIFCSPDHTLPIPVFKRDVVPPSPNWGGRKAKRPVASGKEIHVELRTDQGRRATTDRPRIHADGGREGRESENADSHSFASPTPNCVGQTCAHPLPSSSVPIFPIRSSTTP
jgi:hypothetical protein